MPVWLQIASAVLQLVKLIRDMLKDNPKAAVSCSVAIKEVRKTGDATKLQQLLDSIKRDGSC